MNNSGCLVSCEQFTVLPLLFFTCVLNLLCGSYEDLTAFSSSCIIVLHKFTVMSSMCVVDDVKCVWVFLSNPFCLSQLFVCVFMVNQGQILYVCVATSDCSV